MYIYTCTCTCMHHVICMCVYYADWCHKSKHIDPNRTNNVQLCHQNLMYMYMYMYIIMWFRSFEVSTKLAQQWLACVPLVIYLEPINKGLMLLVIIIII